MNTLQKLSSQAQDRWAQFFVVAAIVIFAFSGWAWWHFVRSNPQRTFNAALNNSLRTRGMSRIVDQANGSQDLEQKVQLSQGAQNVAQGQTTIQQSGDVSANIVTQTIGTPYEDFVQYTKIETSQKSKDGKDLDFSELLGVWGKSTPTSGGQTTGELYNESVLGVVPMANLSAKQRTALMDMIVEKKVYQIDLDKVGRGIENGRPVYTYDVTVAPEAYVGMLKEFAKSAGLTQLEGINPADYKDSQPLTFKLKVDVWAQNFTAVEYQDGARSERYGSWGVSRSVKIPTETVPVEDLQSRLQAVQ